MNIFGLYITRRSKHDIEERKIFQNIVYRLDAALLAYNDYMKTCVIDDVNNSMSIIEFIEDISNLVNLYQNNRFSKPGDTFSVSQHLEKLKAYSASCADRITNYNMLEKSWNNGKIDENVSYELVENDLNIMSHNFVIDKNHIQIHAKCLRIAIQRDVTRLTLGIDVIREYYMENHVNDKECKNDNNNMKITMHKHNE